MKKTADVVICGAGIAGISVAYHLAVNHGVTDIVLVDNRAPLSLTSDKSTECYRNWWPGPGDAMVRLMNRSIDILEELARQSGNIFHLNRRGYLYLTADQKKIPQFSEDAAEPSTLGAGPLRVYSGSDNDPIYQPAPAEGFENQPSGADLILDQELLKRHFPYISNKAKAALHVRRAGWFSAQQLGMYLLDQARNHGLELVTERVTGVDSTAGQVSDVKLSNGCTISTSTFVNAAGPYIKDVGRMLGLDIPVYSELHIKVAIKDHLGAIPRHAPLLIWTDPQYLPWSEEEHRFLQGEADTQWLLDELPQGVHTRPEGGLDSNIILILWTYDIDPVEPIFPPPLDEEYPEVALRGLVTMLPKMGDYIGKSPKPSLDGGYYTKTSENRPLIGPTAVEGAYIIGALSGYGLMAACASGELLAAHITGSPLPGYADAFTLERYNNPSYQRLLANWGPSGQL
jgi:glycine/D-amino acid oxidase-like deaminating enzyme